MDDGWWMMAAKKLWRVAAGGASAASLYSLLRGNEGVAALAPPAPNGTAPAPCSADLFPVDDTRSSQRWI